MATLRNLTTVMNEYPAMITDSGAFLFENEFIEKYRTNKNYKYGDIVVRYNPTKKLYLLYRAIGNTNGVFNDLHWELWNLETAVAEMNSTVVEDLMEIVKHLTPIINKEMTLNHVHVKPLNTVSDIKLVSGGYDDGCLFI